MPNPQIDIFMRPFCGFCSHAMSLLDSLGATYNTYDIWEDPAHKEAMNKRAPNASTVPQIFINGQHIGGCDDLVLLHKKGALEPLLS